MCWSEDPNIWNQTAHVVADVMRLYLHYLLQHVVNEGISSTSTSRAV